MTCFVNPVTLSLVIRPCQVRLPYYFRPLSCKNKPAALSNKVLQMFKVTGPLNQHPEQGQGPGVEVGETFWRPPAQELSLEVVSVKSRRVVHLCTVVSMIFERLSCL